MSAKPMLTFCCELDNRLYVCWACTIGNKALVWHLLPVAMLGDARGDKKSWLATSGDTDAACSQFLTWMVPSLASRDVMKINAGYSIRLSFCLPSHNCSESCALAQIVPTFYNAPHILPLSQPPKRTTATPKRVICECLLHQHSPVACRLWIPAGLWGLPQWSRAE